VSEISSISFKKFGTDINMRIVVGVDVDVEKAEDDLKKCQALYGKYDKIFSRFDVGSELSGLNLRLKVFQNASNDILEVAEKCLWYNKNTKGLFDPRIIDLLELLGYDKDFPMIGKDGFKKGYFLENIDIELQQDLKVENGKIFFARRMDFSGIVKGWVTDKIAKFLLSRGWKNFLIDSGGDMYFSGIDRNLQKWTVDVEGFSSGRLAFAFSKAGIATSGIGKRKWEIGGKRVHHLINPKRPDKFSFDLRSVTVVADSVEEADVWAKTLFLMGKERAIAYSKGNNIKSLLLDYKGNVWISSELLDCRV